nr:reverse transcriptase domain-containing protein [Tanacetum cinerariifolium]
MPLLPAMLLQALAGEGVEVADQAVPQPMPAPAQSPAHLPTPFRPQPSDPIALVLEHGQSSDPHIASFSQALETDAGPFTIVEDAPMWSDFHTSLTRASHAPPACQLSGAVTIDSDIPSGSSLQIPAASPSVPTTVPLGTSSVPPAPFAVPPSPSDVPTGASIIPAGSPTVPTDVSSRADPTGVSSKGKSLMVEEDIPIRVRTFKQMEEDRLGEEAAKWLHDEKMAEMERERAETLLGDDVSEDNFPVRMAALIKKKRQALAEQLFKERQNRPMTQAQHKAYMQQHVKNQSSAIYNTGWTMAYVKSFTDDQLKQEFEKIHKSKSLEEPTLFMTEVPLSPAVSSPPSSHTRRKSLGRKHMHKPKSTLPKLDLDAPAQTFLKVVVKEDSDDEDSDNEVWSAVVGWEILHMVDRQDLVKLYGLVVQYYENHPVAGAGLLFWGDLQVKLMERMLTHKLEIDSDIVGNDLTIAEQLIQFIKNQLVKDEYEVWAMKMEYWITNNDMNIWMVIQHGNSMKRTGRDRDGRVIILPLTTPEEHIANAIKARFGGNAESKKIRKSMLRQEFSEFRISEAEGLHKGYDRMQKILSQLNQLKAKPEDEDINLKFLRALPSSWSQVALTLKTKGGLELLSFDDLYYKLKTLDVDVKGNVLEDVLHYFVADTEPEQHMAYKYFEQIEKLDLEEMDLKWQMAMLSVRVHKFEQKAKRKLDFDKKESARFNKKKVRCYKCQQRGHFARECRVKRDHNDEGDEVITAKEFSMIAGCDSKDAIKKGAAKIYNLITRTDTEEVTTADDAGEFALMGVTSERVLQQNQLTLEEKIMVLSIKLNNTSNLLKHYKRINDDFENAKKDLQIKLDTHLVQTKKENELGWDDSAFSVFTTNSEDVEGRPIFHMFSKTDSMKAVPPPLSGDYTSLSDHSDLDESQMSHGTTSSTLVTLNLCLMTLSLVMIVTSLQRSKQMTLPLVILMSNLQSTRQMILPHVHQLPVVGPAVRPQPVPTGKPKVRPVPTGNPKVKPVSTGKPKVTPVPTGKPKVTPVPTGKPQVSTPVPTGRPNRPFPVPTNRGFSPSVISSWWSLKIYLEWDPTAIKLMLFPYSLEEVAKIWYEKEPPRSILTWGDLHEQDSLNVTAGGNLLRKTTQDALIIIENKSKVRYSQNMPVTFKVSTTSSGNSSSTDARIDKLMDIISNLVETFNKKMTTPTTVKAVEETCVICGGAHPYYDCIATDSNISSVCATTSTYNQGNIGFRPQVATKYRASPLGFPLITETSIRAMQNQIDNFKARLRNEIHSSIQNQINSVKNELRSDISNQTNELRNMMVSYFQMNTASFLGSGSLPSNTVPNPRADLKAITTRSGVTLAGPSVSLPPSKEVDQEPETLTDQVLTGSTNNVPPLVVKPSPVSISFSTISSSKMPEVTKDTVQPSTKNIQPSVVQTQVPIDEPVVAPKPKPTIPYPSRANKQKLHKKDDMLALKFLKIFRNLHFELSFVDAFLHMPNPAPTLDPIISSSSPSFTPFKGSDFILEEIETFLQTSDELSNLDDDYFDTEGDILYLEKLLIDDMSLNFPSMKTEDLKQVDATMTKPLIEEPPELKLKELPPWVSPIHCVPKKGGMIVVENEDNELIPTRHVPKVHDSHFPLYDRENDGVGAVLGQRKTKHFQPIHYSIKTMMDAQAHYTTTKKELLAVVYAFEKFRPYLFLSKTIVYTDHSALKYLLAKQDSKSRFVWWILLLQEFDVIIRDKKRAENLAADHLSRLENPH